MSLEPIRAAAFWVAVVLPFVAVAVLSMGLESLTDWALFVSILLLNSVTLYAGHPYASGGSS